jgi:anti-anti-sigma factor
MTVQPPPPPEIVLTDECIRLSGELVDYWAAATSAKLRTLAAAANWDTIRLDLSGVAFCDSSGLREILGWSRSLPLQIIAVDQRLERKIALAGMTEILLSPGAWGRPPRDR